MSLANVQNVGVVNSNIKMSRANFSNDEPKLGKLQS